MSASSRPPLVAECKPFYVPIIDVTSPVDFGERVLGSEAASLRFRVRNIGWADLTVESIAVAGGDARAFKLAPGAAPFSLAPKAGRDVTVTFTPSTHGRKSASLEVLSNAHNARTCEVLLLGAVVQPLMSLSGPIDFGVVKAGEKESAGEVIITSEGDAPLKVNRITLEDAKHFEVRPPSLPLSVRPGDHAKVRVVLLHRGIEKWTTKLKVESNAVRNPVQSVSITGEVRGWIAFEVVDEDKKPVADLELVVKQQGGSEAPCRTDPEGRARVEGLRAGPCEVLAASGGTVYEVVGLTSRAGESGEARK